VIALASETPDLDPPTYALISLGCPKNLVDSERMAGRLQLRGYRMVGEPDGADFAVVNTCGFIGDARDESYGVIREMLDLKQQGKLGGLIVAGCLAERDRETLLEEYPDIDQLVGVFARDEITAAADRLLSGRRDSSHLAGRDVTSSRGARRLPSSSSRGARRLLSTRSIFPPAPARPPEDTGRLRVTPRHLAFLKIAEGCNRQCSFCTIPSLRGPYASKPIEQIVAEAEELAADGVRELVLVAQDTSYYGLDLGGEPQLAELLWRLNDIGSLAWIRLMYLYPMYVTDAVIDAVATAEKVLPYLDMPLQHAADDVLRRMRRQVNRRQTEALLGRLRDRIPGLVLRTTLLTGFPGETEEHFEELLDFVREQRFERLGAFCYSAESGTPAAELEGLVPKDVGSARRDRLLAVQQQTAFAYNAAQIGRTVDVILDRDIPDAPDAYVGRTYADAPEVDGVVYVTAGDIAGRNVAVGQIVACEIVDARDYDLIGVAVG